MADEELASLFDDPKFTYLREPESAAYPTETCPKNTLGDASKIARTKFRDYMHARSVPCGKVFGWPIL